MAYLALNLALTTLHGRLGLAVLGTAALYLAIAGMRALLYPAAPDRTPDDSTQAG